ncbi:50S ribosomal protein L10 [Hyphomonas beringensis]|uniref:Large ribosomal subunit protein uL10 n=1 Tax=Hyphomonas beringensis TaxID=1280946 RepID=A0A062UF22_9PROT|nr:50S ribosomal protein L10 [Hyphomonas beringensis]KCZ54690.1 50S ribosomal protein L10 [Hyphomonas beringensis]
MDKAGKTVALETLKGVFDESGAVVVTHYTGLTVAEMTKLRGMLRKDGAQLKVVKNRLAKIALDGKGGDAAQELFQGPVAIAFSPDPVSAAKAADEFAKENSKLVIIGAVMGDEVLDAKGVESLAKLPSLDQLRGKLIGLLQAPATKVAGVVQAPAGQLARVVAAYGNKDAA